MTQPTNRTRTHTAGFTDSAYLVLRQMRADLIATLHEAILARGWSDAAAAATLHIGQPRISAIKAERWERFSLELLLGLAVRANLAPRIVMDDPRTVVPLARQTSTAGVPRRGLSTSGG